MSGFKETDMALAAEQARVVAIRTQANAAHTAIRALAGELTATVAKVANPAALRPLSRQVSDKQTQADKLVSRATGLTAWSRHVATVEAECGQLLTEVDELSTRFRHLRAGLGLGETLAAALGRLEAQTELLSRWDAPLYEALSRGCTDLQSEVEQALRRNQNPEARRAAVEALVRQLTEFEQSVLRREAQDTARRHLIASVEEACARLHYTIRHAPSSNPNEPARFEVNTGCYGVLKFELGLDAVLRTADPRIQPGCEKWVEGFEDQMGRLGVRLQFHFVQTRQPVRKGKAAQVASVSCPAGAEQGGGA